MVSITVRNVPQAVRDELAARAARADQSLEEYLREMLIEAVSRPLVADVVARARSRVRAAGVRVDSGATLDARDTERR